MDIVNAASARADMYDRNATIVGLRYTALLSPHGATVRATYTVPAGKKAYIGFCIAYIKRWTAAFPQGFPRASCYVELLAGGSMNLVESVSPMTAVDVDVNTFGNTGMFALPGDVITLLTEDNSTNGTVQYLLDAAIATFDY